MSYKKQLISKTILCNHNEYSYNHIYEHLCKTFVKKLENNYIILDIISIEKIYDKFVIENGIRCRVDFLTNIYSIEFDSVVDLNVISSSYIGTYMYDPKIGKELASFYMSKSTDKKFIKARILDKRVSNELRYLVEEV